MSSLAYLCRRLLLGAPILVAALLLCTRPASAEPVSVNMIVQGAALFYQGGATGTFTVISPSEAELYFAVQNVPEGSGVSESFDADIIFSNGSVSGDGEITLSYSAGAVPPFGAVSTFDTLSFTSGNYSLGPDGITAQAFGDGFYCDVLCEEIGFPGISGSAFLSLSATPTPEPSSLLLLGTGLLGIGPFIRRRFARHHLLS